MSFWTSQHLKRRQFSGDIVSPFNEDHVKHGAYELALSRDVLTTPGPKRLRRWRDKRFFLIQPGQFALLYTEEALKIPKDALAFISIKASLKLNGLINISGFHVDPGFCGKLKFSVYNAGSEPIELEYGKPTFPIWFCDFESDVDDPYDGNHQNQNNITREDRRSLRNATHSPATLHDRVKSLERKWKIAVCVFIAFLLPFIAAVSVALCQIAFKYLDEGKLFPKSAPTQNSGSISK